jgi:hypothetical protein
MVFRIRDKSLFWTKSGWKNNWDPKVLQMPKAINSPVTQYVTCRFDFHSFLRSINYIIQLYNLIATSPAPPNNISTEIPTSNSSSFLNYGTISNYLFIAKPLSNSSRTELYISIYLGTQICRSYWSRVWVNQSQLSSSTALHIRTTQ